MTRTRVVHLLTAPGIYGTERLALESMRALSDHDVECHAVFLLDPGADADPVLRAALDEFAGVDPHFLLAGHRNAWTAPRTLWRVARHLRAIGADVVHTYLTSATMYGGLAARLARVPVVETVTMSTAPARSGTQRKWWYRRRLVNSLSTRQIYVSRAARDTYAAEHLADASSPIVYLGFDQSGFDVVRTAAERAAKRREVGLRDHDLVVLAVGRLDPDKRQRVMVEAFTQVVARHPSARLVIAGDGEDRDALERQVKSAGLAEHVLLLGPRGDVPELLDLADVYVSASVRESLLGYATLEALAAGRPVVAARIAANEELLVDQQHALLAEPDAPVAFATAINDLLGDPRRAACLAEAGRELVRTRCGLSRLGAELADVYRSVLSHS